MAEPLFDSSGNFVLFINALYSDTVDPTKTFFNVPDAHLSPASPATWSATIKQVLVDNGVANGFTDLTSTGVFIPTYG
jgi:hypothetical protein